MEVMALLLALEAHAVKRVSNTKRVYKRGYKFTFDFAQPNSYAGFKLYLDRFHTDQKTIQRPSRSDS
jgi:hypothetical protein